MKARQTACRGRATGFGTSSSEKTPTTPAAPRHGSRFLETSAMMKRACAIALTFTLAACGSSKTPTTPSSTATPQRRTISGQVVDLATGTPIAGAFVNSGTVSPSGTFFSGFGTSATTDGSGNYSLSVLVAADLSTIIYVSAAYYLTQSRSDTFRSNQTMSFQLERAATRTVHLTGNATDDDGAPVVGATVSVTVETGDSHQFPSFSTVTDGRGFYTVTFDAPAGVGYVQADSPGHDHFIGYLNFTSGSRTSQDISENLHIYQIKRITAGDSTLVTVVPGDSYCADSAYELALCRTVHVVVPIAGQLSMTCPGLTMLSWPPFMPAGEIAVNIGLQYGSTVSPKQSCLLTTSLTH
jgi:hypothetical protein